MVAHTAQKLALPATIGRYQLLARIASHRVQEVWAMPMDPEQVEAFWKH